MEIDLKSEDLSRFYPLHWLRVTMPKFMINLLRNFEMAVRNQLGVPERFLWWAPDPNGIHASYFRVTICTVAKVKVDYIMFLYHLPTGSKCCCQNQIIDLV